MADLAYPGFVKLASAIMLYSYVVTGDGSLPKGGLTPNRWSAPQDPTPLGGR